MTRAERSLLELTADLSGLYDRQDRLAERLWDLLIRLEAHPEERTTIDGLIPELFHVIESQQGWCEDADHPNYHVSCRAVEVLAELRPAARAWMPALVEAYKDAEAFCVRREIIVATRTLGEVEARDELRTWSYAHWPKSRRRWKVKQLLKFFEVT